MPRRAIEPPTLEAWEELTGPTEEVVEGVEVTATYGKQSRSKQAVYDQRTAELLSERDSRLEGGVEDPQDPGTFFRLTGPELAKIGLVNANIATGKYTADTDVEDFGVWKTNGTIRNLGSLGEAKNTAKRLADYIMGLDECTRIHVINLGELLADTINWAGGYTGPGHAAPFDAQDIAEYDFTSDPGLCWPS